MAQKVRLGLFLGAAALVLVLNAVFGWSDMLLGEGALGRLQDYAAGNLFWAGLAYVCLSVVGSVALALPGVAFALVAGTVFGALWGTLLCWGAMSIGACLSFLAARWLLKGSLKPKLAQSQTLNRLLFEGAPKRDVYLLAVTRLVPVFPFNLQNFAYGITDVRFVPYAVYSTLFILPGTAMYTVGAAGVFGDGNRLAYLAVAAALLAVSTGAAAILKRSAALS